MITHPLIDHCARLGIDLEVASGQLRITAPLGVVTPELKDQLAANKPYIIEALEQSERLAQILKAARTVYFEHRDTCSICRTGWAASERCSVHAELWQLYESALVGVHGAEKVLGSPNKVAARTHSTF